MMGKKFSSDPVGRFFFGFLLFLLAVLVLLQVALTVPSWRVRLNPLEAMEGTPIKGFSADDLPSGREIW